MCDHLTVDLVGHRCPMYAVTTRYDNTYHVPQFLADNCYKERPQIWA